MKNLPARSTCVASMALSLVLATASPAQTQRTLVQWRFDSASQWQGWRPNGKIRDVVFDEDGVVFNTIGPDPQLSSPLFEVAQATNHQWVVVDLDCSAGGTAELYYTNTTEGQYGGLRPAWHALVTVPGAGRQTVAIWPFWSGLGRVIRLRFDPPSGVRCRLYAIRIVEAEGPAVAPSWTFGQNGDSWQSMRAARLERTADALLVKALHPQATIITATEPFDAARRSILKLAADCPGEDILGLYWATRQEPGLYGEPIPLVVDEEGGGYSLDLRLFPEWRGDVTHLAISFGTLGTETLTLRSLAIEENDPNQPLLRTPYLGFENAINRPGTPAMLRLELEHAAGPALPACQATVAIDGHIHNLAVPPIQPGERTVLMQTCVPQSTGPVRLCLQVNVQRFTRTLRIDRPLDIDQAARRSPDGYDVPAPRPVKTPYEIGIYYFPGWSPDQAHRWEKQKGFHEREPVLGWYEEGRPEVADWHIKWATENGISFFVYDWYWRDGKEELTAGLNDGFLKARYRDQMKFALMWANHKPFADHTLQQLLTVTDYWIEHYFHRPNYLTVDGKPYVSFYDLRQLLSDLGSADKVRAALEAMRRRVREATLPGLHISACVHAMQSIPELLGRSGFDSVTAYHYLSIIAAAKQSPYRSFLLSHKAIWQRNEQAYALPYIPLLGVGWDSRPWHGPRAKRRFHRRTKDFAEALAMLKSHLDATGRRMAILEAWNEWGEGSYIEPNVEFGFEDIEAIRATFAEPGDWPVNIGPSDIGLGGKYDLRRKPDARVSSSSKAD